MWPELDGGRIEPYILYDPEDLTYYPWPSVVLIMPKGHSKQSCESTVVPGNGEDMLTKESKESI